MKDMFSIVPKDLLLRMEATDDGLEVVCTRDAVPICADATLQPTAKRVALLKQAGMSVPDPLRVVDLVRASAATATTHRARALAQIFFLSYEASSPLSRFMAVAPTTYDALCGENRNIVPRTRRRTTR